jgi:hypothetical protein
MKVIFVAIAWLLLLQPVGALSSGVRMVNICYVPIGAETYVPMTAANIEQHCVRIGQVGATDKRYLELKAALQKAESGSFDSEAVRVKLTEPDSDSIYVDNAGGVSKGKSQLRLSASSLAKVKRLVEDMTVPKTR